MDGDLRRPVVDLPALVDALAEVEVAHRPNVPLREDMQHVPVSCSCGRQFASGNEWEQARRHLREEMALAVVRALHRVCETCLGSGIWRKLRQDMECPDCEGTGRVLAPLPPMMYRNDEGQMFWVERSNPFRDDAFLVWAHPHSD
jgi:hypothetical protein